MQDWDKWAAKLPEPHRKAILASQGIADELERTDTTPLVLLNVLRTTYPRQMGNLFQMAFADNFVGGNKVMRWRDFELLFERYPNYRHLRPLLVRVAHDLCGEGNYPLGIGFIEFRGMGKVAEHETRNARAHGIPDEAHDRTWMIPLTDDHKHGGEVYFPARKSAFAAKPGTAFVFPRTARWGIAPLADYEGQRSKRRAIRLMMGWGSRMSKYAEYGGFPGPEQNVIIDPTKPPGDDNYFGEVDDEYDDDHEEDMEDIEE